MKLINTLKEIIESYMEKHILRTIFIQAAIIVALIIFVINVDFADVVQFNERLTDSIMNLIFPE